MADRKVEALPKRGFGTELIERGLRFELQGDAKLEVVDGNIEWRMNITADPERILFLTPAERPEREDVD